MHETIRQRLIAPRFEGDKVRFLRAMSHVNYAHVLMLRDGGLMRDETAKELLRAIRSVTREHKERIDGSRTEDFYFAFEAAVLQETGQLGGDLHIGRSRNDITACLAAMQLRDQVNNVLMSLLALQGSMLRLAEIHTETVMPGYTHLRAAQPTTFGHYLTGVVCALRRDIDRLQLVARQLNDCPMGAAAFAGTSHAIDRQSVASMLGFERPTLHSLDAVASRDVHLHFIASCVVLSSTLGRFIQDLYVWSTAEFGFVNLSEQITGVSSIMPQKRNPIVLERCRAKSGIILAALVAAASALKASGFMHSHDSSVDGTAPAWSASSETIDLLEVLRVVVETLEVDVTAMTDRSRSGFLTSTEIADYLVRVHRVPFRTAHGVVASAVRALGQDTQDAEAWCAAIAQSASREAVQIPRLEPDVLSEIIDPSASVARRTSSGSPTPEQVRLILADLRPWVEDRLKEVQLEESRLRGAELALEERVKSETRAHVRWTPLNDQEEV